MSDYKTVAVRVDTHAQISKLAEQYHLTQKDLIAAMVQYFVSTKVDPRQPKADTVDVSLKKMTEKIDALDKRVIGFFREQEKTLIKPILSEVQAARVDIKQTIKPRSPVPAGITAQDLDTLSESLQSAFFLLLGKALTVDVLEQSFIEEYNGKVTAE